MGGEGDTGPVKLSRLAAAGGVAGPVLFTVAWVAGSLRQAGRSVAEVQLSGLAAEDARDPQIMMAGFVLLGAGTVVFGAGLGRVAAPRSAGSWLVLVAGVASVAAGLFRRDHMLLAGPGFAGESWHNQVHDVVSGVAYGAMLAAPLVLARRWHDDPDWAPVSRPVQVLTLASAAALAVFASRIAGLHNGVVQRIAVTLPLTAEILIAGRMLTLPATGSPPGPASRRARERQSTRAAETVPSPPAGGTSPGPVRRSRPDRVHTCRNDNFIREHIYARGGKLTHAFDPVGDHRAALFYRFGGKSDRRLGAPFAGVSQPVGQAQISRLSRGPPPKV